LEFHVKTLQPNLYAETDCHVCIYGEQGQKKLLNLKPLLTKLQSIWTAAYMSLCLIVLFAHLFRNTKRNGENF